MEKYEKPAVLATYSEKELAKEAAVCTGDGYRGHRRGGYR
jgi:hypothetical protein